MGMIVAITGQIGAGKTTTAGIFAEHGFAVLGVDELGHDLLDNDEVSQKLRAEFGMQILDRDLRVDREKLSKIVFNDGQSLMKLNEIVHPLLKSEIRRRLEAAASDTAVDVALYEELGISEFADKVILVTSDLEHIYKRLAPLYTREEILNVMNHQRLVRSPDHILDNNGSLQDLKRKAEQLIRDILL